MLMRGSTDQVDSLVATWKTMETTIGALAASLRADLDRLLPGWDSPAGREFDRRVGLIAEYAQTLAEEFCRDPHRAVGDGRPRWPTRRSRPSTPTSRRPPPRPHGTARRGHAAAPARHRRRRRGRRQLGHEVDQAEKEKARDRMVPVVCALAAEYRVVDYGTWPPRVPPPPVDTPQVRPEHVTVASAPVVVAQPQAQPATDPVTAAVDPSIHKPRHGHPDMPAPIPPRGRAWATTTPTSRAPTSGAAPVRPSRPGSASSRPAAWWPRRLSSRGTPRPAWVTRRPRTDRRTRHRRRGAVAPVPVGGGEGTTANLTAVGHDHTGVSATGGPSVHVAGSELAGSSREGAVSVGSVGADGDTRGPGTAPPPPAVMGGMPGAPGGPGAAGPGGAGAAGTGSVGSSAGYGGGGYSGGGGGSSGYSYGSGGSSAGSPGGAGYAGGAGPGASGGAGPGGTVRRCDSTRGRRLERSDRVGRGDGTGAIGGPGGGGGGAAARVPTLAVRRSVAVGYHRHSGLLVAGPFGFVAGRGLGPRGRRLTVRAPSTAIMDLTAWNDLCARPLGHGRRRPAPHHGHRAREVRRVAARRSKVITAHGHRAREVRVLPRGAPR